MAKIIYIAGLGHSGSTLLDMSLGAAHGVYGLGELKTLMDENSRDRHLRSTCSCGKIAGKCEVWKDFPSVMKGLDSDEEKLEATISHLKSVMKGPVILVDSSKNSYPYLQFLNENHSLKLIFLTRDIRSWAYSRFLSSGKPMLYFMVRWWAENRKLLYRIKRMGIVPFFAGYEEIAMYPEYLLREIADFAEIPFSESMLSPDKTSSHIISGNIARVDTDKRKAWVYDARWLISRRILIASPLLLCVQGLNRKLVYSNTRGDSAKDFFLFSNRKKGDLSKKFN